MGKKKSFLDRYYVIDDLQYRGQLKPSVYDTFEAAWKAYEALPGDKVKALGASKVPDPMPGCFDFIQCIRGKDKLIADYQNTPSWKNPEVEALIEKIQTCLAQQETPVCTVTPAGWDYYNAIKERESGQVKTRYVSSNHGDRPDNPLPVGRIEFLGSNGQAGEEVEYTDPELFESDIKKENWYGTPMCIYLYKDKNGEIIPHSFISQMDPPAKKVVIVDAPVTEKNKKQKRRLKNELSNLA